jgi:2,4-dienoyl-CoA reductase-like NADH-dependent reductase (Old Yellow Enzyme family)
VIPLLFEPGCIGKMVVKNRFVRTAVGDGWCTLDGECTDELINFYRQLADGGCGLIITGASYVDQKYKVGRFIGMYSDRLIADYKKLTQAVHDYDAKIVCQLFLPGRADLENPTGPSPVKLYLTGTTPRELTEQEIQELVNAFAQAARRTKEAGFDGIQFHAAHGYLLHSFLSPYTNQRKDKWGGSFENNMRFLLEIYRKSRELVGNDYPVLIKVNAQDYIKRGISLDLGKRYAEIISAVGFNALELSAGVNTDRPLFYMAKGDLPANYRIMGKDFEQTRRILKAIKGLEDDIKFKESYFRPFASEIKKLIDIPLILPGGNRTVSVMDDILRSGDADFIGLCRPLIREPDFPNKVKKWGQKKAECLNCNRCLSTGKIPPCGPTPCYQKLYRPERFHL